jgi:hypothetical protein
MDINLEIIRASKIMAKYHVSREDQADVVKILLDAGIQHCLDEQERLRSEKEQMIRQAQGARYQN